jgi:hypothetical protein
VQEDSSELYKQEIFNNHANILREERGLAILKHVMSHNFGWKTADPKFFTTSPLMPLPHIPCHTGRQHYTPSLHALSLNLPPDSCSTCACKATPFSSLFPVASLFLLLHLT